MKSIRKFCGGVQFADLSEIRDKAEYRASMGQKVYGDDGEEHIIEHSGVANHPGDSGMEYIANIVIANIKD